MLLWARAFQRIFPRPLPPSAGCVSGKWGIRLRAVYGSPGNHCAEGEACSATATIRERRLRNACAVVRTGGISTALPGGAQGQVLGSGVTRSDPRERTARRQSKRHVEIPRSRPREGRGRVTDGLGVPGEENCTWESTPGISSGNTLMMNRCWGRLGGLNWKNLSLTNF